MAQIHCISCIDPRQQQQLASQLKANESNVFEFDENELLKTLYGYDVYDFSSYLKSSMRLKNALMPLWQALFQQNLTLLLQFSAHTREQQSWLTQLARKTGQAVILHTPKTMSADAQGCSIAKIKAQIYALGENFEQPVEGAMVDVVEHD